MIKTIYGEVERDIVVDNLSKMIGKTFKMIHLKEENCETIEKYRDSLCRKFLGVSNLYFKEDSLMIVNILSGTNLAVHEDLRSDIFEVIKIIEDMKKRV